MKINLTINILIKHVGCYLLDSMDAMNINKFQQLLLYKMYTKA